VPELIEADDLTLVIQMTTVKRPFVLDFAGAYLDGPPKFTPEIWEYWEKEKREQFENRWEIVQKVIDEFQCLGIYLTDVTPSNINF
jgi:hypothetical protein